MSLRTYALISHSSYKQLVGGAIATRRDIEKAPSLPAPTSCPTLETVLDIADYLGVSKRILAGIYINPSRHYRTFAVRKRSGGKRMISSPRTYLKVVQWWIYDNILKNASLPPSAYGFVPGRSYLDNAHVHHGASHVLNMDIMDFFPSIQFEAVFRVFQEFGYAPEVASDLTKLTTFGGRLPQGAPTSPFLANLVFSKLDDALFIIAAAAKARYTRYADDITFSSNQRIPDTLLSEVEKILGSSGFKLNPAKTRFMGSNQRKEVTGIVLGQHAPCLSREYLNSTRGWFHAVIRSPDLHATELDRVRGTLALIRMVGGRGSARLIAQGEAALRALTRDD